MRRIVVWLMSTFTVLVLLFGYRTSLGPAATAAASSAVAPETTGVTSGAAASSGASSTPSIAASAVAGGTTITVPSAGATSAPGTAASTPSSTTSPSTSSSSAAATADATYTGTAASTRWGDVQVAITVSGGTITAVDVPEYPTGNPKDQQINARALPVLVQETLTAQSASIDMVSGATVTSEGYLSSLQSALDQAGL